ncbi:peptidoglycan DD-metalloendopeptidase family protein [Phyllobacterium sp. SYP-B3895]|uniref:murein hydrolase activator EnvC family protein n=1 Tax=Phyllobacterium sp. SYP-B3895 TaxID=2663240 RepID=UPI0012997D56|nr:murein hydrolase activator EnvC [Phyllobacterium sp. SYP-B3895]MRG54887.1 peptidoglycan DD-metalloendopeptidase family protein [Phyllobacterium sp. SYP-B3895]
MIFEALKAVFHPRRLGLTCSALFAFALWCAAPAHSQETPPAPTPPAAESLDARRVQSLKELEDLTSQISLSSERVSALDNEIAGLKKDQTTITAALIQSAQTEKKLTQDIAGFTNKLADLHGQEDSVRTSLRQRRGALAEVLAALQRMGLSPPPALLVRPDDALASVRSAVLLGAVVPEMRQQTEVLIADLKELDRVKNSIAEEQTRLTAALSSQAEEKKRLDLLLSEKQKLQTTSEETRMAEQARSEELAKRATSLRDLIASLEKDMQEVQKAASAASAQEQQKLQASQQRADDFAANQNRLSAQVNFASLKSHLALPAAGKLVKHFGDDDGLGGVLQGDTLETLPGATITAPMDAVVLYAGAFRSYGQLLILDAGNGYHVVLAGMKKINVSQNQFVLAGEPVGVMNEQLVASTAPVPMGNGAPMLYIEFRKDTKPINPAPWWADRLAGRTANDT